MTSWRKSRSRIPAEPVPFARRGAFTHHEETSSPLRRLPGDVDRDLERRERLAAADQVKSLPSQRGRGSAVIASFLALPGQVAALPSRDHKTYTANLGLVKAVKV
jgi:hypothetical protein